MIFLWLALVLPPTLAFGYVASSGLFLLLRAALRNTRSVAIGPLIVFAIITSGYFLSFHEVARPIWQFLGTFVTQLVLQLSSIASASASTATDLNSKDWLGSSSDVLVPIIERNAPLSHLVAVALGIFMSSFVTSMTDTFKKRQIPEYMYGFVDSSFRIVLSLEFYLGTALWFRFCLAPALAFLGLTTTLAANISWMGTLVLGFSHTIAFVFGNFMHQDYYRRGFDKQPEYAFVKYYSIYGSIFVIGRMTSQVLSSIRPCTREEEALLMLAIYLLAFLHVAIAKESFFHNVVWPIMVGASFAIFFGASYIEVASAAVQNSVSVTLGSKSPVLLITLTSLLTVLMTIVVQAYTAPTPIPEDAPVHDRIHDQKRRALQFPPPYPNGWYKLARSGDVPAGKVINVNGLGRSFAVFRGQDDGQVHVLDALCPHLGANIAIGGTVDGDTVSCPFHGWKFDGRGTCVDIPYAKSVPSIAKTKQWNSREYAGIVVVWYDAENREPMYEPVPFPFESKKFRSVGYRRGTLPMHLQDFAENAADWMHFNLLHDRLSVPILDRFFYVRHKTKCNYDETSDPYNFVFNDYPQVHSIFWEKPIKAAEAVAQVEFTGPGGLVYFRFFTQQGQICIIKSFLPVGEKGLQLTMEDEAYAEDSVPTLVAKHVVREANKAFDDDIFVWRHKTYLSKPMFVKEDAPVKQFRDYYKKFYSPNSRTYAHDTLDW